MKKLLVCALVILFAVSVTAVSSFAQEEDTTYVYGEVVSASSDAITITEVAFDEETGEEVVSQATYTIAEGAEVENADSVAAIPEGEAVDIEVIEIDGKKHAKYIYVYSETDEEQ